MIFKLLPTAPVWSEADAAGLRDFLGGALGQRVLQNLFYQRPDVGKFTLSLEHRAAMADRRAGFEEAITELMKLADKDASITESAVQAHLRTVRTIATEPAPGQVSVPSEVNPQ